ncbi:hypothetical protein KL86PLE_30044 [uncultured Pleomorphomonas sp.]|uniref:Uncharacterized protein n=1 Tax=uncultured Pleomorphomonas sp. TaxID=442121 RepID=A0A212LDM6_9HYPH|nr:hypothetical protein KL86PLE_30044 [uncultured Pleomorphomonas sp.]
MRHGRTMEASRRVGTAAGRIRVVSYVKIRNILSRLGIRGAVRRELIGKFFRSACFSGPLRC